MLDLKSYLHISDILTVVKQICNKLVLDAYLLSLVSFGAQYVFTANFSQALFIM